MKDVTKKYLKGSGIVAIVLMILSGVDVSTLLERNESPNDVDTAVQKLADEVEVMRVMAEHRKLRIEIARYDQMLRPVARPAGRATLVPPPIVDANDIK